MSVSWVPPRPTHHLRVFAVSLLLVVLCLAGVLFGVEMEATVPAKGIITARDVEEVRTILGGLVEPGWFEDNQFHRIQPGDELRSGQVIAVIRTDAQRHRLRQVEDKLKERESRGESPAPLDREQDRLREQLRQAILRVPESHDRWLVLKVKVSPLQAVVPGEPIATLVPVDPQTHQPRDLVARLEVDEKHWGSLAPGQAMRLSSAVHSHRLHGHALARIERLEPCAGAGPGEQRCFHATAPIVEAPFAMPIGSSFHADVIVGRKRVYRIILEH